MFVQLVNDNHHHYSSRSSVPCEGDAFQLFHLRTLGGEGLGIVAKLVTSRGMPYDGAQSINLVRAPESEGEYGHLTRTSTLTIQHGQELPIGRPYCNRILVPLTEAEIKYIGF